MAGNDKTALVETIRALSIEKKVQLFVDWITTEDDTFKNTCFVNWMQMEKGNRTYLKKLSKKAAAVYVTNGFTKKDTSAIELRMEKMLMEGASRFTIIYSILNWSGMKPCMLPMIKNAVSRVMNKINSREAMRKKRGTTGTTERESASVILSILNDDLYNVNITTPKLPEVDITALLAKHKITFEMEDSPVPEEVDSKITQDDYDRLLAPYSDILENVYKEYFYPIRNKVHMHGDCPSVIVPGHYRLDEETKDIKKHKDIYSILSRVSLYDHTYNVLRCTLDIMNDSGITRHADMGARIAVLILAALSHDIGKIPMLWDGSKVKKAGHEGVSSEYIRMAFLSSGNTALVERIAQAVYQHRPKNRYEISSDAKILVQADAAARAYEVSSADPFFRSSSSPF